MKKELAGGSIGAPLPNLCRVKAIIHLTFFTPSTIGVLSFDWGNTKLNIFELYAIIAL